MKAILPVFDESRKKPYYLQLYDYIKELILSGDISENELNSYAVIGTVNKTADIVTERVAGNEFIIFFARLGKSVFFMLIFGKIFG